MSKESFLSAVRDFALENPDKIEDEDFYWNNINTLKKEHLSYNEATGTGKNNE